MSISRFKLLNYLNVLRKHLPGHSTDEVHQAMDGIEEVYACISLNFRRNNWIFGIGFQLCSLLKTESKPPYVRPLPVERAFEANEGASKKKQPKDSVPSKRPSIADTLAGRTVAGRSRTFSACQSYDGVMDDLERARKSRYEIPDNQLSRKARNILDGKKEVEMLEVNPSDEDKSECDDRKLVPDIDPSGDRYSPENV